MAATATSPSAARITEGELIEFEGEAAKLVRAIGAAERAEHSARAEARRHNRTEWDTPSVHVERDLAENLAEIIERLIELARRAQ